MNAVCIGDQQAGRRKAADVFLHFLDLRLDELLEALVEGVVVEPVVVDPEGVAAAGGRERPLVALSLQPAAQERRKEPLHPRLQRTAAILPRIPHG